MTAPLLRLSPVRAAENLREALARRGITAEIRGGYGRAQGLALVLVQADLVVWSNGEWFWWHAGWNPNRRRAVYASQEATAPDRAAHRIAFRYTRPEQGSSPPMPVAGGPL